MSKAKLVRRRYRHTPVLSSEVMRLLDPEPGHLILDATVGTGNHARLFLARIVPGGRLIGLDRDNEMLRQAAMNLSEFSGHFRLFHANFVDLVSGALEPFPNLGDSGTCPSGRVQSPRSHTHQGIGSKGFDGVFLDLGISSAQLDTPERGFSFAMDKDGPLDMRMDRSSEGPTARDLIAELPGDDIERIFSDYGEERWARKIAKAIVRARATHPIETTTQLADVVSSCTPRRKRERGQGNEDVLARIFMSLRIATNDELNQLEQFMTHAWKLLKPGGRIAVADFHSGEDKIIKRHFREWSERGICRVLTKNPIRPSPSEVANNPRSRSAKLRAAERLC